MNKECEVRVLRSVAEIEAARADWELWQHNPNADLDYFLKVVEMRDPVERPHVLLATSHGEPRALLAGRLEAGALGVAFGYRTLLRPRVRSLTVVFGGILGDLDERLADAVLAELEATLRRREVDVVLLSQIPVESTLYRRSLELSRRRREPSPAHTPHWVLDLPDSYEAYLKTLSRNGRKSARIARNRVDKEFGDAVEIQRFDRLDQLEDAASAMEAVARLTYQRGLGVGFADSPEMRETMRNALERGLLHAWVLFLKGQPVAFDLGWRYGDTVFLGSGGYDPAFEYFRPGTYLFVKEIETLCADDAIRHIDLGFGDAAYKRTFCHRAWDETSVYLYGPSLRIQAIKLARAALTRADRVTQRWLERWGLRDRIRRAWRRSVRPSAE